MRGLPSASQTEEPSYGLIITSALCTSVNKARTAPRADGCLQFSQTNGSPQSLSG